MGRGHRTGVRTGKAGRPHGGKRLSPEPVYPGKGLRLTGRTESAWCRSDDPPPDAVTFPATPIRSGLLP